MVCTEGTTALGANSLNVTTGHSPLPCPHRGSLPVDRDSSIPSRTGDHSPGQSWSVWSITRISRATSLDATVDSRELTFLSKEQQQMSQYTSCT